MDLRLEIAHRTEHERLTITRLDYLLTGFALQRADNAQWIEAGEQIIGLGKSANGTMRMELGTVPDGEYQALRFFIGPDAQQNASDPNDYPPEHPLHPQVCGLHWGWQGGYIFMALEGRTQDGEAFSYHLATDEHRTEVVLPMKLKASKRATLRLELNAAALFSAEGLNPWSGKTSTHSRKGDTLPVTMAEALPAAFQLTSINRDFFRQPEAAPSAQSPKHGTPYELQVSNRLPKFILPADNPLTVEGIALGKRLFEDPLLSADGTISCASCHHQEFGFGEATAVSTGIHGKQGRRNAMPLFNLAWQKEFFWDGHVGDLRQQILEPIQDEAEMGESLGRVVTKLIEAKDYAPAFAESFGDRAVTPDRIAMAIEQYLLTLVSQNARFDQAMRGEVEFTAAEKRGFQLFVSEKDPELGLHGADCFHCHGGSLFSSIDYFDNGLGIDPKDAGRFEVTGKEADRGKFKAPSLRNITETAPYMHDGRFSTLMQVIEHYDSGVQPTPNLDPNLAKHPDLGLQLSADDKAALLAFLRTLSDPEFLGK